MALVACTNCSGKISSLAVTCPKCGAATGVVPPEAKPSPKQPSQPKVVPKAVPRPKETTAGPAPQREDAAAAPPPPPPRKAEPELPPAEEWYYVAASGRQGPVPLQQIRKLAAAGSVPAETPVWKPGLSDWVPLSEYRESAAEAATEEPEAVAPLSGSTPLWALALAPLWGGILQIVITETAVSRSRHKLAYYGEFWWIIILVNVAVCFADYHRYRKGEPEVGKQESWLCLAVPVYLYLRERKTSPRLTRLWVWVASLIVMLTLIVYLNGIYAKISIK